MKGVIRVEMAEARDRALTPFDMLFFASSNAFVEMAEARDRALTPDHLLLKLLTSFQ